MSQDQLRNSVLITAGVGLCLASGLCLLTYGIGAAWNLASETNKFIPVGWNPYKAMSMRFLLMSICFLIFTITFWKPENIIYRLFQFALLVVLLIQSWALINTMPEKLPDYVFNYSANLSVILYSGLFFSGLSVVLLVLYGLLLYRHLQVFRGNSES